MKFIYKLLSLSLAIACLSGCSAANTEIASSSAATATVTPTTDSTEVPLPTMFLHLQGTVYMLPLTPESMNCKQCFRTLQTYFILMPIQRNAFFYVRTPIVHMQMKAAPVTQLHLQRCFRPCFCVLAISFWSSLLKPPTPVTRMGC